MSRAYYNEIEPAAAHLLRCLIEDGVIAPGDVDERSIKDVQPRDLAGYTQCHFFAGGGLWSVAARLAGWADNRELWTGSCPCQPWSRASHGKGKGELDERDLWKDWFRLIAECSPSIVFGEQVAAAKHWCDRMCDDMEAVDYSVWAAILPAVSVGADHVRERLYFAGYANSNSKPILPVNDEMARLQRCYGFGSGVVFKDDVPNRMAALRIAGNAIVPQVAAEAIKALMDVL